MSWELCRSAACSDEVGAKVSPNSLDGGRVAHLAAREGSKDSLIVQRSHVRVDPQESLFLDTILLLSGSCDLVEHELFFIDEGSFRFGFEVLGGGGEGSSGSSGGVGGGVI